MPSRTLIDAWLLDQIALHPARLDLFLHDPSRLQSQWNDGGTDMSGWNTRTMCHSVLRLLRRKHVTIDGLDDSHLLLRLLGKGGDQGTSEQLAFEAQNYAIRITAEGGAWWEQRLNVYWPWYMEFEMRTYRRHYKRVCIQSASWCRRSEALSAICCLYNVNDSYGLRRFAWSEQKNVVINEWKTLPQLYCVEFSCRYAVHGGDRLHQFFRHGSKKSAWHLLRPFRYPAEWNGGIRLDGM